MDAEPRSRSGSARSNGALPSMPYPAQPAEPGTVPLPSLHSTLPTASSSAGGWPEATSSPRNIVPPYPSSGPHTAVSAQQPGTPMTGTPVNVDGADMQLPPQVQQRAVGLRTAFLAYSRGADWRPPLSSIASAAEGASPASTGMLSSTMGSHSHTQEGGGVGGRGLGMTLTQWMKLCTDMGVPQSHGGPVHGAVLQTIFGAYRPHNTNKLTYLAFVQAVAALSTQLRVNLVDAVGRHGASMRYNWKLQQLVQLSQMQQQAPSAARALRAPLLAVLEGDLDLAADMNLDATEVLREATFLMQLQETLGYPGGSSEQLQEGTDAEVPWGGWQPRDPPPHLPLPSIASLAPPPDALAPPGSNLTPPSRGNPSNSAFSSAYGPGSTGHSTLAVGSFGAGGFGGGSAGAGLGSVGGAGGGAGVGGVERTRRSPPRLQGNWVRGERAESSNGPHAPGGSRSKPYPQQLRPLRGTATVVADGEEPDTASAPVGLGDRAGRSRSGGAAAAPEAHSGGRSGPGGSSSISPSRGSRGSVGSRTAAGAAAASATDAVKLPSLPPVGRQSGSIGSGAPVPRSARTSLTTLADGGGGGGGGNAVSYDASLVASLLARVEQLERSAAAHESGLGEVGGRVRVLEVTEAALAAAKRKLGAGAGARSGSNDGAGEGTNTGPVIDSAALVAATTAAAAAASERQAQQLREDLAALSKDMANRYAVLELRTSEPPVPPLASSHSSSRALLPSTLTSPSAAPSRSHSRTSGIRSLKERSRKAMTVPGDGSVVAAAIAASTLDEHFDSRLQYLVAEISGRIRNEVLATTAESASQAIAAAARAAASVAETSNQIFVGVRSELDERLRQLDERVALLAQQQAGGGGAAAAGGDAAAGALALVQGELRTLGGAVREMQVQQQAAVGLAQQALAAAEAQAASLAKVQAEAATAAATQAAALAKVQADVEEQAAAVGAAQVAAEAAQKEAAEVARGVAMAGSVVSGGLVSAAEAIAAAPGEAAAEPGPASASAATAAAAAVPPLSRGGGGSRGSPSRGASRNLSRNSASGQARSSDTGSGGGARRSGSNLPLQPSMSMHRNEQQQQQWQQQWQQQQQAMAEGLEQLRAMVLELQQQVVLELKPQHHASYQQVQQELLRVREDAQRAARAASESAAAAAAAMAAVAEATGAVAAADGVAVADLDAVVDGGVAAGDGAEQVEGLQLDDGDKGESEGVVQEQQGGGVEGGVDAVARVGSGRSTAEAAEGEEGADGVAVGGRPPLGNARGSRAGSRLGGATAAEVQAAVQRLEGQLTALGAKVAADIGQLQEQVAAAAAAPAGAAARPVVAEGDGGGGLLDADASPAEVRAAVNNIHGQLVSLTASFGATAELAAKAHSAAVTAAALSGGGAAVGNPALTIEALVARMSALEAGAATAVKGAVVADLEERLSQVEEQVVVQGGAATDQQQQQVSYEQVQQELLRVREDAQKAALAAAESASAAAAAMAAVAAATGAVAAADGVAVGMVSAVDGGVTAGNSAGQGAYQQLQQEQEAVSVAAAAAAAPEVASRARQSMELWSAFLRERGIEPLSAALPRPYTLVSSVAAHPQQPHGGSAAPGQLGAPVASSDEASLVQKAGGAMGQVGGTGESYSGAGLARGGAAAAAVGSASGRFVDAGARLSLCDVEMVLALLLQDLKQVQAILQAEGNSAGAAKVAALGGVMGAVAGAVEADEMQHKARQPEAFVQEPQQLQQVVLQQTVLAQELLELQERVAAAEAAAAHAAEAADDIGALPEIMHNGLSSLTQQLEAVQAEQQQLLASVSPQQLQGLVEEVAVLRERLVRAEEAAAEARDAASAVGMAKEAAGHQNPEALISQHSSTSGAGRTSTPGVPSRASSLSGVAGRTSNAGRISTVSAIPEDVEVSGGSEVGGPGTPEQGVGAAAGSAGAAGTDREDVVMAEVQRRLDNLANEVRANMDQLSSSIISEVEGARTETAIMVSREVASQLAAAGGTAGRGPGAAGRMHASEGGVPSRAQSSASVGREEGVGVGVGVGVDGGVDGGATEAVLRALQERLTSMEQELSDVSKEVADVCKAADMTTESVELLTKHVQNIEQAQNQAHDTLRNQVEELMRNAQQGAAAVAQRAAARRSATGDAQPLPSAQPPPADNDLIDALAELHFQLTELQEQNLPSRVLELEGRAQAFQQSTERQLAALGDTAAQQQAAITAAAAAAAAAAAGASLNGGASSGSVGSNGINPQQLQAVLFELRDKVDGMQDLLHEQEHGLDVLAQVAEGATVSAREVTARVEALETRVATHTQALEDVKRDGTPPSILRGRSKSVPGLMDGQADGGQPQTPEAPAPVLTGRPSVKFGAAAELEDTKAQVSELEKRLDELEKSEQVRRAAVAALGRQVEAVSSRLDGMDSRLQDAEMEAAAARAGGGAAAAAAAAGQQGHGGGGGGGALGGVDAEALSRDWQARLKAAAKVLEDKLRSESAKAAADIDDLRKGSGKLREKASVHDEVIIKLARRIDKLAKRVQGLLEAEEAETMTSYSAIGRDQLGGALSRVGSRRSEGGHEDEQDLGDEAEYRHDEVEDRSLPHTPESHHQFGGLGATAPGHGQRPLPGLR